MRDSGIHIWIDFSGLIFTDTGPYRDLIRVINYFWLIHPNFDKYHDIPC